MKLVMMGTGPFAVPTFKALIAAGFDVPLLVTRPPVEGPGKKNSPPSPMATAAEELKVPMFHPEDVNHAASREHLTQLEPDLFVVCDYGQILSADTLAVSRLGGINLHGSLLPKYRGAAPVQWALWKGETETGVSVIHLTPRLDAGPCLAQERVAIEPSDTAATLERRLAELGAELVVKVVTDLGDGIVEPIPQDGSQATRAPRLKKEQGAVDWSQPAEAIRNQVRALQPWPTTYTYWHRRDKRPVRLILEEVQVEDGESDRPPGQVMRANAAGFLVATGTHPLAIVRVQPAGKRSMSAAEFLRGHPVQQGDRLGPE